MDAGTIVTLARVARSIGDFEQAVLDQLLRHVGADVGLFQVRPTGAPAARGFRADVVGDWQSARARHATELAPVLTAARTGASVDAEVLGERRVRSTRYFAEVVRPHGGRDTLYALPAWDAQPVGCLVLGRCGPRGRFRRRDQAAVDALLPTIALASIGVVKRARRRAATALSPRESELVELLRRGLRSKEIGGALGTSPNTVRNQIWRMMARVGAGTRAELIAICSCDDDR